MGMCVGHLWTFLAMVSCSRCMWIERKIKKKFEEKIIYSGDDGISCKNNKLLFMRWLKDTEIWFPLLQHTFNVFNNNPANYFTFFTVMLIVYEFQSFFNKLFFYVFSMTPKIVINFLFAISSCFFLFCLRTFFRLT